MSSENFTNNTMNCFSRDRTKVENHSYLDQNSILDGNYINNHNVIYNNYDNNVQSQNDKNNKIQKDNENFTNIGPSEYITNQNDLQKYLRNHDNNISNNYDNFKKQNYNYSIYDFKNENDINTINENPNNDNKNLFDNDNNNQEKNSNNSFNFNSSNFNNTLINKSTNNNTRLSLDNKDYSKNQQLENNSINENSNAEEKAINNNQKILASKRNYSLNPAALKSMKYNQNSVIHNKQINIIPHITKQPFSSLTETKNKNLILNVEVENSICYTCHDIIEDNEIIYFCSCERIFHLSCLSEFLTKKGKTIHNPCDECENNYKIFYFKLIKSDDDEEISNEENFSGAPKNYSMGKSCINGNNSIYLNSNSVTNTNINNLDNYEAMCELAMQINYESMSEIISKNEYTNKSISMNGTPYSIGRIPLSPIPVNITPYTGKSKNKNISYINDNSENNNDGII